MCLSSDIIESGYVREYGFGVKVRWKGTMVGEDGETKLYGGVNKGSKLVPYPLRNKETFLTAEETLIGCFKSATGGLNMGECVTNMVVERCHIPNP